MLRDPVLLLPVAVAAGLAVGGLGVHEHVAGTRIAADLALAWALTAAALVVAGAAALASGEVAARRGGLRAPGRRSRVGELARAVDARLPARGAVGRRPGSARARPSPRGGPGRARPGSRSPAPSQSTLGGQLVGALVAPDARDLLSVAPRAERRPRDRPGAGDRRPRPSLWSCSSSSCSGCAALRGAARRSQGPLLVAAAVSTLVGLVWLGWVIATDAQRADARDDRAGGRRVASGRGRRGDRLVAPASPGSVRARRRAASADGGDDARAARAGARRPHARGRLPARRRPLRRRGGPAGRAAARPATVPSRR